MTPRDRRHLLVLAILVATLVTMISVLGCAPVVTRPSIQWVKTSRGYDYYAWVDFDLRTEAGRKTMEMMCGVKELRQEIGEGGMGCTPLCLRNAVVPVGARRMSDDSVIDHVIDGGDFCWIYSSATWQQAQWAKGACVGDELRHLEHEKKHAAGWTHQLLSTLRGDIQ